jgi:hypothetical protein
MSNRQIPSGPFNENAQRVIQVSSDYLVNDADDIIDIIADGVTVTLPANPLYGQRHRLLASGGNVAIDGNGHAVVGGISPIPLNSGAEITFSTLDRWISTGESGPPYHAMASFDVTAESDGTFTLNIVKTDQCTVGTITVHPGQFLEVGLTLTIPLADNEQTSYLTMHIVNVGDLAPFIPVLLVTGSDESIGLPLDSAIPPISPVTVQVHYIVFKFRNT